MLLFFLAIKRLNNKRINAGFGQIERESGDSGLQVVVLLGRRPAAQHLARRAQAVMGDIAAQQQQGGAVAVDFGREAAEAGHLRRRGVQALPTIAGRVANVERIVAHRAQIGQAMRARGGS